MTDLTSMETAAQNMAAVYGPITPQRAASAPDPAAPGTLSPKGGGASSKPSPELTPKTVLKMCRQRLKEVKREIKTHTSATNKLVEEKNQLSRLLDAADGINEKPANVTSIKSRASG